MLSPTHTSQRNSIFNSIFTFQKVSKAEKTYPIIMPYRSPSSTKTPIIIIILIVERRTTTSTSMQWHITSISLFLSKSPKELYFLYDNIFPSKSAHKKGLQYFFYSFFWIVAHFPFHSSILPRSLPQRNKPRKKLARHTSFLLKWFGFFASTFHQLYSSLPTSYKDI